MIELTFLKELMLIRHVNQKSAVFCHYWHFLDKGFHFQAHVCNGSHDLLMMSMNLSNIALLLIIAVSLVELAKESP